jgi:PAT family beta-lactamase induction signal transducer AmpG
VTRQSRIASSPVTFFFLVLPYGISGGFVAVTLPFALTRAGFSVAAAASIVAIGFSANIWRFLWGPVADLTLTLRRWYVVGAVSGAATLLLLSLMPLRDNAILSAIVFLSQVAGTLVVLPLGGLMAHTVADAAKGRASGWYQAGNLGGLGAGGGAGVWLTEHYSIGTAGAVLAMAMLVPIAALYFVPPVRPLAGQRFGEKMIEIGRDFRQMLSSRAILVTLALLASPVGIGAASNLWSAVAADWRVSPDTVAVVTGALGGLVSAAGCVAGGWIADRVGRWWAFFGSGTLMAVVAAAMAAVPRTPAVYTVGVLCYAFSLGVANAGFSAIVLHVIGRGAASAKYAILVSLGNVPLVYMTAFDGWMHDRAGAGGMLDAEAAIGAVCVVLGLAAVWKAGVSTRSVPPVPFNA